MFHVILVVGPPESWDIGATILNISHQGGKFGAKSSAHKGGAFVVYLMDLE